MRRPRHLSPEERAIWDHVARQAQPLNPKKPKPAPEAKAPPKRPSSVVPQRDLPDFTVGMKADIARSHDILPPLRERLQRAPIQMDAKNFMRMKSGKLKPEGRLDLHGMYRDEAYPELIAFILNAQAAGKRLVLVITGKGTSSDDWAGGRGVLRRQVPQWLQLPPIGPAVLEVRPAHLKHGGDGAYYVYLRRRK
ncbi:DNA mismatch repair protein MutS [Loktanella sp. 3ANDIMAR09]|uniref:Smr/MutS family protein n=1 Tax=Loktanella sp. 3ANDIMAR09 TaxID=1225657 RepID=UPI0006F99A36|nr:Smr/MutS family protein [Loktanella sp. 3ANDIMAR09]KQI70096.1 DNA mismatch repair protein MutS [Loktanella sp. 3ANDIMAR09]